MTGCPIDVLSWYTWYVFTIPTLGQVDEGLSWRLRSNHHEFRPYLLLNCSNPMRVSSMDKVGDSNLICPWKFLSNDGDEGGKYQQQIRGNHKQTKGVSKASYVDITRKNAQPAVEFSELPVPGHKGEYPSIKISKKAYERGLDYCKFSCLARFDLQNSSIDVLRLQAKAQWRPSGEWAITPLGKGYLHIRFSNAHDFDKVWSSGPWKFDNQILRLSKWEKNFNPESQKQTHALIWVKFPGLPMEFWDPESLMSIGRSVGYPMQIDDNTLEKKFGYFASVLVDVDFANPIPDQVFVEAEGIEFWQNIEVSKMPKFCNHCKIVGHLVGECRKLKVEIVSFEKSEIVTQVAPGEFKEKRRRKGRGRKTNNSPSSSAPLAASMLEQETVALEHDANRSQGRKQLSRHPDVPMVCNSFAVLANEEKEEEYHLDNLAAVHTETNLVKVVGNFSVDQEKEQGRLFNDAHDDELELSDGSVSGSALEGLDENVQISMDKDDIIHFQLAEFDNALITKVYGVNFGTACTEWLSMESPPSLNWEGRLVDDPDWGPMLHFTGDVRKEAAVVLYDTGYAPLERIKIHRPPKQLKVKYNLAHWGNFSVVA